MGREVHGRVDGWIHRWMDKCTCGRIRRCIRCIQRSYAYLIASSSNMTRIWQALNSTARRNINLRTVWEIAKGWKSILLQGDDCTSYLLRLSNVFCPYSPRLLREWHPLAKGKALNINVSIYIKLFPGPLSRQSRLGSSFNHYEEHCELYW